MLRFFKWAAMIGVPFGLLMSGLFVYRWGWPIGLSAGLLSGLLFGLLLAAFATWQRSRFMHATPDLAGERLLKQGPANHFAGWESVGGWLVLTDRRLLFRSHRFNLRNHALSIPLEDIADMQPCRTGWIIPNGLRVTTAQRAEQFVLEDRRSWMEAIDRARHP